MRMIILIPTLFIMIGAITLILIELFFRDNPTGDSANHGDHYGVTSGRPRVIGYIVVGIVGFIAMLVELAVVYSR